MMKSGLIIVTALIAVCFAQPPSNDIVEEYEFEDVVDVSETQFWQWRSEASNNKSLRLEDESGGTYEVILTLCAAPVQGKNNINVMIDNIVYSNDGDSDQISVTMDMKTFSFITVGQSGSGFLWNRFLSSGKFGGTWIVGAGQHPLTVWVTTDMYGVELDQISISAKFQDPGTQLICGAQFVDTTAQ